MTPCFRLSRPVPAIAGLALFVPAAQAADNQGFTEGATATLQARSYYFSRDFSDIVGANRQSKAEEWAQGFILDLRSGYTTGTLGFGVDIIGLLGIKLDSSPGRVGSGLLPLDGDGRAQDEYSRLAAALKMKLSETELRIGELQPSLPVLTFSDIRLLPPSYQGASLVSKEFIGLTLQAGQLRSTSLRNQSGDEPLQAMLGHVPQRAVDTDRFHYAGADYAFNGNRTSIGIWYAALQDIYAQR